jgi:tRNA-splicing ligase RtcB
VPPRQLAPKLLSWASILEDSTREQALKTAQMPFIEPHLALMPDAHLGKGATVGSVIPTVGAIMPAAVGVDIGCGMIAVRTQYLRDELPRNRTALRESIEAAIPLSAGNYNDAITESAALRIAELRALDGAADADLVAGTWPRQLGTLGSGNHFIEVTVDETERVWLFLHSGSRGVGNKLAMMHIAIAERACAGVTLPDRDLAYLTEGTPAFDDYMRCLRWAQQFARLNREEMMDRLVSCFEAWHGPVERTEVINCHHNYTEQETHFGRLVWLSRKGAIDASAGTAGLIPGSMGAASYVVVGKGNAESLNSSPHGAGRNHSRNAARKLFTRDDLERAMRGIEWRRTDAFLDEHPQAYKDIDVVMADAADLVEVRHTLRQIVNVKGD